MGRSALTPAERAKRYRQKKKVKLRNPPELTSEKQKGLARVQRFRSRLSDEAKKNRAVKQKEYRDSKGDHDTTDQSDPKQVRSDLASPYKSRCSAGKAVAKAKAALPQDETFRKYVWQRIGIEYGYLSADDITPEDKRSLSDVEQQHIDRQDELLKQVEHFYFRRDVSYTTPGIFLNFCASLKSLNYQNIFF